MRLLIATAVIAFLLDQLSKVVVVHWLRLSERGTMDVLPPFLNFRMGWNRGVNFGLFSGDSDLGRWVLVSVALIICIGVVYWVRREAGDRRVMISAGLLVGGALSNVLDRLIYGAVADFLNMSCCAIDNPFAFNIADVWVFSGAVGLVLFAGKAKEA
jgi:signal peptidase II